MIGAGRLALLRAVLARHGAVLRAAWAVRHELAGPRRLADEAAFLPAALSLQETPPHPAPRRLAWALVLFFALALAWAAFGQLDIVATAPGRIVVSGNSKTVQPLEAGVVRAIHVANGSRVAAGELLVELDATMPGADLRGLAQQRLAAQAEARRSEWLLRALSVGPRPGLLPPRPALEPAQGELLETEWSDIAARLARLDAEQQRRAAEQATAGAVLDKLQATLPIARKREADYLALVEQGFMAGHAQQDRTRERMELERELAVQSARMAEASLALEEARRTRQAYVAETLRVLHDRREQAKLRAHQLEQDLGKSRHRETLTQLRAPVAGVVQQLAVHTAGGVVTPAQPLMVIVPEESRLVAEVTLENKDIGFVAAGHSAELKLETFPFTRYGTVPARLEWVSPDAVIDDKLGVVYAARLAPLPATGTPAGSAGALPLAPGMKLTAEIRTGSRPVWEYFFSAVVRPVDEALGER